MLLLLLVLTLPVADGHEIEDDAGLKSLFATPADAADLPGGTWKDSSRNIESEDGLLSCELQNEAGDWVEASTEYGAGDEFENRDGVFKMTKVRHHHRPCNGFSPSVSHAPAAATMRAILILSWSYCYIIIYYRMGARRGVARVGTSPACHVWQSGNPPPVPYFAEETVVERTPEQTALLQRASYGGWLKKRGGSWKSWKTRWFSIDDGYICYAVHRDEVPIAKISVSRCRLKKWVPSKSSHLKAGDKEAGE